MVSLSNGKHLNYFNFVLFLRLVPELEVVVDILFAIFVIMLCVNLS